MTTIAAIKIALALLPEVKTGIVELIAFIAKLRSAARQTGDWTPEFEAQWRDGLLTHGLRPEEVPDPV